MQHLEKLGAQEDCGLAYDAPRKSRNAVRQFGGLGGIPSSTLCRRPQAPTNCDHNDSETLFGQVAQGDTGADVCTRTDNNAGIGVKTQGKMGNKVDPPYPPVCGRDARSVIKNDTPESHARNMRHVWGQPLERLKKPC